MVVTAVVPNVRNNIISSGLPLVLRPICREIFFGVWDIRDDTMTISTYGMESAHRCRVQQSTITAKVSSINILIHLE